MTKTKQISLISLFTALTIIGSQITIPIGTVPFTMQVFFVFLSGIMLGPKMGMISQTVYLLLGAIGIPAFAKFGSGLGILFGPTGGFLLSFPIAAFLIGFGKNKVQKITYSLLGLGIIYFLGWLRLGVYLSDFQKAFIAGVAPFIAFDFLKIWMAYFAAFSFKKAYGALLNQN